MNRRHFLFSWLCIHPLKTLFYNKNSRSNYDHHYTTVVLNKYLYYLWLYLKCFQPPWAHRSQFFFLPRLHVDIIRLFSRCRRTFVGSVRFIESFFHFSTGLRKPSRFVSIANILSLCFRRRFRLTFPSSFIREFIRGAVVNFRTRRKIIPEHYFNQVSTSINLS